MVLVGFEFLDSCIEGADTCEHFIVLVFELFDLQSGLNQLLLKIINLVEAILTLLFCLVEMRLHVSSGSNGLNCEPLLSLKLLLEVVPLTDELVVLLHRHGHPPDGIIFLLLAFLSEDGLSSEHRWQELCVALDPLEFVVQTLLVGPRILELGHVEVLVFIAFVLRVFEFEPLFHLMDLVLLDSVLQLLDLKTQLRIGVLQLVELVGLIHLALVVILILTMQLLDQFLILLPELFQLLVGLFYFLS